MKKTLLCAVVAMLSLFICCSCSADNDTSDGEMTSPIALETFESEIIERISAQEHFDVFSIDNVTSYSRPGLEYSVKCSETGYIQSVSVIVTDADIQFIDEITYYNIEKPDKGLDAAKKASVDAIRYFAMPLTLLCDLGDTDAIDTALEARSKQITENGWELTLVKGEYTVEFNIVYTG